MRYLVTGGSGFLGVKLIERLINQGHEVVTVARNEGKLIELQQKYPVKIITGDISDPFICRLALKDSYSGVFHLAAFKHVGLAEAQPRECIKSNIIGSLNLLEGSLHNHLPFIIGISTDKAAKVSGVYGASKLLMESLFKQFDSLYSNVTKYRVVRYGNVLYSTGSVLCKWKDAFIHKKQLTVTDCDATRFFWTIDQAVDLIFECLDKSVDATPYIPSMKSLRIGDLLIAMAKKYGNGFLATKTIGLQPGENMHETLDGKTSSNEVPQYTVEEILELI